MTRIFLLTALVAESLFLHGQSRVTPSQQAIPSIDFAEYKILSTPDSLTLLYMPFPAFYVDSLDSVNFSVRNTDLDHLTPFYSWQDTAWGLHSSVKSWDYMPGDSDSAYYISATSWFDTTGKADNWFSFGPVTIPPEGAILSWYVKTNPRYRDGYEVLLSETGLNDTADFKSPAVYSRADCGACDSTDAADTVFRDVSVNIPGSYSGKQIFFAFHHNAYDMDALYIDNILVQNSLAGIRNVRSSSGLFLSQNYPNPFRLSSVISYELPAPSEVSIAISDLTGRVAGNYHLGKQEKGMHNFTIQAGQPESGIYFYTLTTRTGSISRMMVVE